MYAGPPGRGRSRKKEGTVGGVDGTVEDWYRCVRNLSVSSRENWAHRLIDGTGSYWQSCGQEGKVGRDLLRIQRGSDMCVLFILVKFRTCQCYQMQSTGEQCVISYVHNCA